MTPKTPQSSMCCLHSGLWVVLTVPHRHCCSTLAVCRNVQRDPCLLSIWCGGLQYQTSDARDEPVMDAFKAFLKDEVPQAARNKPIKSLLWWNWSNSPDSGSITAATGDVGEYSKVLFILPYLALTLNTWTSNLIQSSLWCPHHRVASLILLQESSGYF